GSGYNSWVIAGIDWVAANAADIEVANMSLGGTGTDDTDGGDCHASADAMNLAICNTVDAGVV
ncbi:MAG: peptidase S8, partial [Actinobacteria bacterium]|nr:peptidase S8 [Actinomycetota bacterium]